MAKRSLVERMRRLLLSHEELEASELREEAQVAGAQSLRSAPPRSKVTLRGTVSSVTTDSKHGWLEAELNDGSGTVSLVWMGRSRIECLIPGRKLQVSGRLADEDGHMVIYNPEFELVP